MNNLLKIATGLLAAGKLKPVDKKEEECWASAQNKNFNIRLKPILVSQSCYGPAYSKQA